MEPEQLNLADMKARLAAVGGTVDPDAQIVLRDKPVEPGFPVVIVERVKAGYTPPYCVHGYASCLRCDNFCYLGSETSKAVVDGDVLPLCQECGKVARDTAMATRIGRIEPTGRLEDHLREDGPHE